MFPENEYLYPAVADSSRLLVGCRREDYSASRIAHAVEDCNAHLLNLNVTSQEFKPAVDKGQADGPMPEPKFPVMVDIRVSHRNSDSISRSLERYGFTVLEVDHPSTSDNDILRRRIDEFFRYLEI